MRNFILLVIGIPLLFAGESEIVKETETEIISEQQSETSSESETEIPGIIRVTNVDVAYPEGERAFDDTQKVELILETEQNIPGDVRVEAIGTAAASDVGTWQVIPEYTLSGKDAKAFELLVPSVNLSVTIVPKVLQIEISDAVKEYFTECEIGQMNFGDKEALCVSGFMKDGVETTTPPNGFEPPELTVDQKVLTKQSLMFDRQGKSLVYRDALIIKKSQSGNTTPNYCYDLTDSKHYRKGAVRLTKGKKAVPYQWQQTAGNHWQDSSGRLWLSSGSVLKFTPKAGSGYNQTIMTEEITGGEGYTFVFRYVDKRGYIRAESAVHEFSFQIDGTAPMGAFQMEDGKEGPLYSNKEIHIQPNVQDIETGVKSSEYLIAIADQNRNEIIESYPAGQWQGIEGDSQISLSREGEWIVALRVEDMVGNVSFAFTSVLTLDMTTPEIRISGVQDGDTYNGAIVPRIEATDMYLLGQSTKITVNGRQNDGVDIPYTFRQKKESVAYRLRGFEEVTKADDHYILQVEVGDRAGNIAKKEIAFTLNRKGSTFQLAADTQQNIQAFYVREAFDVRIMEQNLDELKEVKLICSRDDQITILAEADYSLEQVRDQSGKWNYHYQIPAEYFTEEGHYLISLQTSDRAGNRAEMQLSQQTVEFTLDKTAPICVISGVDSEAAYYETHREIKVSAAENYKLEKMQLYVNGEVVAETTDMELTYTLRQSNYWQTVSVQAQDAAGNKFHSEEMPVWLGRSRPSQKRNTHYNRQEEKPAEEDHANMIITKSAEKPNDEKHIPVWGVVAGGIFVTGVGVPVIIKRKKRVKR